MEKVSVIIPVLNEERYLGKVLGCLARQDYPSLEVIIVDGKSDDGTLKVARSYEGSLDLKIVSSAKRNVAYQRNLGALNSSADLLLFLDADVVLRPSLVKNLVSASRRYSLMIPKYHPISGKWYDDLFFNIINSWYLIVRPFFPGGTGACLFMTKKVYLSVKGFDERMNWNDDLDIIKRARACSRYHIVRDKVYLSTRRFEREGTKKTMIRWVISYFSINFGRGRSDDIRYFHHSAKGDE